MTTSPTKPVIVSWCEVNAALGTVALLLYTIQSHPQSNFQFTKRYRIHPMGSHSNIARVYSKQSSSTTTTTGRTAISTPSLSFPRHSQHPYEQKYESETIQQTQQKQSTSSSSSSEPQPVYYDLFYREDRFQFFAKRNFNTALYGLILCLKDLSNEVLKRDPSLRLPFEITQENHDEDDYSNDEGVVKVGGLDVAYLGDGVEWTKVMRYVAVDLKWLVAYVTRHVEL